MPAASVVVALVIVAQAAAASSPKATRLDRLTWPEAEAILGRDTVVVVPLGAAAAEHGRHLKLGTDFALAEYLTRRIADASSVIIAPPLPYHYYPAFAEYPGSTTLALETARDLTADAVRSLARFGPRRFYVLNLAISAEEALQPAAAALASEGILLRYTDLSAQLAEAARPVREQPRGSHADEVETSMMLYVDPGSVDMQKAARDLSPEPRPFRLTRSPGDAGTYSPTGIWGDATLATREKGRVIVEGLLTSILDDIEQLRRAMLPPVAPPAPPVAPRTHSRPPPGSGSLGGPAEPRTCTPGDERTIHRIAEAFSVAWNNQNFEALGSLWSRDGDILHPDGLVERGVQVITENRRELFTRREYRHSRHPLTLGLIRCLTADVAVADGKWELRGVTDSAGKPLPIMEGLVTLAVKRNESGGWKIEAYRYTFKPAIATLPPSILKRPGYPSGQ